MIAHSAYDDGEGEKDEVETEHIIGPVLVDFLEVKEREVEGGERWTSQR